MFTAENVFFFYTECAMLSLIVYTGHGMAEKGVMNENTLQRSG